MAGLFGVYLAELVLGIVSPRVHRLFGPRHARRHRVAGFAYLVVLCLGLADVILAEISEGILLVPSDSYRLFDSSAARLAFDVALGVAGVMLTLTAAYDFRRAHEERRVKNVASGALDADQTVTFEEMLEHSFYQGINLVQVVYLHFVWRVPARDVATRLLMLAAVTSPWLVRGMFPVNRFSHNYTKAGRDPWAVTSVLYRVKKYQYVFYKHFLLHGINVSAAVAGDVTSGLVETRHFRMYWLALNTAYVMEFFMQTLVKKRHIGQGRMLRMNQFLMAVSSAAAVRVLCEVCLPAAAISLVFNFMNAGRELGNTALVAAVATLYDHCAGSTPSGNDRTGLFMVFAALTAVALPLMWLETWVRAKSVEMSIAELGRDAASEAKAKAREAAATDGNKKKR